jgi:hypothetical protein
MQVLARGRVDKPRFGVWSMGCSIDPATVRAARAVAGIADGSLRLASAAQMTAFLESLAFQASERRTELVA